MRPVTASNSFPSPSIHKLRAEASDLCLRPGEWPAELPTKLGNGLPFQRTRQLQHCGEFAGYRYEQPHRTRYAADSDALILEVIND